MRFKFILTLSLLLALSPLAVLAQSIPGATSLSGGTSAPGGTNSPGSSATSFQNPLNAQNLQQLLGEILQFIVQIGAIFLTLMLIYTGFKFVEARGNEEKITSARTALLWTVIGGLLLLGASAIANAIVSTAQSL